MFPSSVAVSPEVKPTVISKKKQPEQLLAFFPLNGGKEKKPPKLLLRGAILHLSNKFRLSNGICGIIESKEREREWRSKQILSAGERWSKTERDEQKNQEG